MIIQLDDNGKHLDFAPLTLTRPVGNLRSGIFTNDERWKRLISESNICFETESFLSEKFPSQIGGVIVNACVIPNEDVAHAVNKLKGNEQLILDGTWIARMGTGEILVEYKGVDPIIINDRCDLYQKNGQIINQDFDLASKNRTTVQLSSSNTIIGDPSRIFVEEGAKIEAAILNTTDGPIYIGKNAEIMEGSAVRGPLALCEGAVLKMCSKIYGPTTIGPGCKVGGEVNNCIFQANSNKGHDGFLGNSVIGEWCNLGADTNTSNLKNNYGFVKTYSYITNKLEQTDVQFMGLFMGDHSKSGINTMFNTATVVGVCSNVFGSEFPPKHIPSFTWGQGDSVYDFEKAIQGANNMMNRRDIQLTTIEIGILRHLSDKK